MSTLIVPPKVFMAYESFLEEFRRAVESSNGRVLLGPVPLKDSFVRQDRENVIFDFGVYLKGCPCSKLPGRKRLDVAIRALEP